MEPLFKVGSKVTIKDIGDDDSYDYPFSFVPKMAEYKNQSFEIVRIERGMGDFSSYKYYDKYDGLCYYLNAPGHWCWSSPMFQETYEL